MKADTTERPVEQIVSAMQEALAALEEVGQLRLELDVLERDRIAAARAAGAPWEKIAEALDIKSRQGARQRHQRLIESIEQAQDQPVGAAE